MRRAPQTNAEVAGRIESWSGQGPGGIPDILSIAEIVADYLPQIVTALRVPSIHALPKAQDPELREKIVRAIWWSYWPDEVEQWIREHSYILADVVLSGLALVGGKARVTDEQIEAASEKHWLSFKGSGVKVSRTSFIAGAQWALGDHAEAEK
jgi:hypothetical protein